MRFVNPLPFVRDMQVSRDFYRDVVGLEVLCDHGNFVRFSGGFALHEGQSLLKTIFGSGTTPMAPYGRSNLVLYFEDPDMEAVFLRIAPRVDLLHAIETQAWGQRVFRFRDPDGHLVEVGEPQGAE